ncbi:MAG: squalene/phytoene synthase family protein [candidate division Zixibacteria bacterium]|nr:squalene/phytoene synthase family protein [candidate division Zixibacteria bacterium]
MIADQTNNKSRQAELFTKEILPQVSRTFDLAIKFLPEKLGRPVGLAYLLCRIADTFEDSAVMDPLSRQEMLHKYSDLLKVPGSYDLSLMSELQDSFDIKGVSPDSQAETSSFPDHLPSVRLVENMDLVLTAADSMPIDFRNHIYPRVQEMSEGMARYTTLASGKQSEIHFLKDEADWDNYCYFVAGTVGHMLTDIFSDYVGFSDTTRERLHPLGRSFGLGLQKVNVLKDAVIDTSRGVCFLPRTFIDQYGITFGHKSLTGLKGDLRGLVLKVVEICRCHFQDSIEYIKLIPIKYLGLRMFLIVPVMLAAATLRLITDYPQKLLDNGDLKLTRNDVWKLVRKSALCKYSNRMLDYSFGKILPSNLPAK